MERTHHPQQKPGTFQHIQPPQTNYSRSGYEIMFHFSQNSLEIQNLMGQGKLLRK